MRKKKGSATIFVVLLLSVLFILSTGILQLSLASLRQSKSYYDKNLAFYYTEMVTNEVLNHLNYIADVKMGDVYRENFEDGFLKDEKYNIKNFLKDEFNSKIEYYFENQWNSDTQTLIGRITSSYNDIENIEINWNRENNENNEEKLDIIVTIRDASGEKTVRKMTIVFEFNPLREPKKLKEIEKYNKILDYAMIIGGDLRVEGNLEVKGNSNSKSSIYVGGDDTEENDEHGIIVSNGGQFTANDVYIGKQKDKEEEKIGKMRIINANLVNADKDSKIDIIKGDLYCNSIYTFGDEGNNENSYVTNISGNVYIADNVSLYGKGTTMYIGGDLISYEQEDLPDDYRQSSSIVINDEESKLTIGGKVILFGTAFIEELTLDNKPFKTIETTAINPNYGMYSFNPWVNAPSGWFRDYEYKDGTTINMFDINGIKTKSANAARLFVLDSLYKNSFEDNFTYRTDNIQVGNITSSYFPYYFLSSGTLYVEGNDFNINYPILKLNSNEDSSVEGYNDINNYKNSNNTTGYFSKIREKVNVDKINVSLESNYPNYKKNFFKKLKFRDKGFFYSNSYEDYINVVDKNKNKIWYLNGEEIKSKDLDKELNDEKLENLENGALIFKNGDLELDLENNKEITGNIICTGKLTIKGKGKLTLKYDPTVSKKLMYKLIEKEGFDNPLIKGCLATTNINIKSKRQSIVK